MNNRQIEIELNNAYWAHDDKAYQDKLDTYKMMGYKIFRNSKGDHKIQHSGNDSLEFLNNMFGFKGEN